MHSILASLAALTASASAAVIFDFSAGGPYGGAFAGQTSETFTVDGLALTATAALEAGSSNSAPTLAVNGSSEFIGVRTANDPSNSAGPRITNTRDELLLLSLNQAATLEEVWLRAFSENGSEVMRIRHESGTDPFTGLTGYTGDYTIATVPAPRLQFSTSSGNGAPTEVPFGVNGQDPIVFEADTVVSFSTTTGGAVQGGYMIERLVFEVVPEPSTLLLSALAGFGLLRRRR